MLVTYADMIMHHRHTYTIAPKAHRFNICQASIWITLISMNTSQTQTKFIQRKWIQVPYQVYMSFLKKHMTV